MNVSKFNEVITKLISERLFVFNDRKLDLATCVEIYQVIFNTMADVISQSSAPLSNESVNYLAQQYYDAVQINGNQNVEL
ncbi:hypothetical protein ACS2TD_27275, partial [Bacillus cereus group sp. BC334]|uniref:hypothetical protein n=1 Tax=Bacillus cereus group sp. BC334 TaxID=3445305 RepID=UPI003F20C0A8